MFFTTKLFVLSIFPFLLNFFTCFYFNICGSSEFRIVVNDGKISSLKTLLDLKNIFTTQLPNMPKDYICKLVFNRMHRSVVCFKKGIVIGGITFRPFIYEGYIEITFCAITNSQQVNGYGTRLMNHLKHYCQQHQLFRFHIVSFFFHVTQNTI